MNKIIPEFPAGRECIYCELFDFLASLVHKVLEMQHSHILKRFLMKLDVFVGFWKFSMKIQTLSVRDE